MLKDDDKRTTRNGQYLSLSIYDRIDVQMKQTKQISFPIPGVDDWHRQEIL